VSLQLDLRREKRLTFRAQELPRGLRTGLAFVLLQLVQIVELFSAIGVKYGSFTGYRCLVCDGICLLCCSVHVSITQTTLSRQFSSIQLWSFTLAIFGC